MGQTWTFPEVGWSNLVEITSPSVTFTADLLGWRQNDKPGQSLPGLGHSEAPAMKS